MLTFNPCSFDMGKAEIELSEFDALLTSKSEIGERELLNFFKERTQLIYLMGIACSLDFPENYNSETPIFSKYRTDFVITNAAGNDLCLIEFEDAKLDTIFKTVQNEASARYDWGTRIEHGLSQVSDWFYKLSTQQSSEHMENEFGFSKVSYEGFVIAGRDAGISKPEQKNRLRWRIEKTIMDSKYIRFYTFDSLYSAMLQHFNAIKGFSQLP